MGLEGLYVYIYSVEIDPLYDWDVVGVSTTQGGQSLHQLFMRSGSCSCHRGLAHGTPYKGHL